ncbi:MAG: hypothetical protein H0T57_08990 [Rubrobacter sp.]|nr:hypothetical protein [Rubrobacter sp.]
MAELDSFQVDLSVPGIGGVSGTWKPDDSERRAAWEMYVELVTRIAVVKLHPEEGLLREALSSLYSVFGSTRQILREHGPEVAKPKGGGDLSFGYLSVTVLNTVLRPVLAKWHPLLLDYESSKKDGISPLEHEKNWSRGEELRQALEDTRARMIKYADTLGEVAGVPSLISQESKRELG